MPAELKLPAANWMLVPNGAVKPPPKTPPAVRLIVPAKEMTVPLLLKGTPKTEPPLLFAHFRTTPAF